MTGKSGITKKKQNWPGQRSPVRYNVRRFSITIPISLVFFPSQKSEGWPWCEDSETHSSPFLYLSSSLLYLPMLLYHVLCVYGVEISRFYVTDHRDDYCFTIIKTIGSAPVVVKPVEDALLMFVGAQSHCECLFEHCGCSSTHKSIQNDTNWHQCILPSSRDHHVVQTLFFILNFSDYAAYCTYMLETSHTCWYWLIFKYVTGRPRWPLGNQLLGNLGLLGLLGNPGLLDNPGLLGNQVEGWHLKH